MHVFQQVLDKVSEVERSGQQTLAALSTLHAIKVIAKQCCFLSFDIRDDFRVLLSI